MELVVLLFVLLFYWLLRSMVLICVRARRIRKAADAAVLALSTSANPSRKD